VADTDALAVALETGDLAGEARAGRRHLWVLRRLLLGIVVLWVTSVLVFAATQALPGDAAGAILGRQASPEQLADVRAQLGLDEPVVSQYTDWLTGLLSGDLGTSLAADLPVGQVIGDRLVNSLALVVFTALIALPLAVLLGVISAYRRDRALDKALLLTSFGLTALPEFVVGLLLLILLSTTVLSLFPAVALIPPGETAFTHPGELVLLVATLTLVVAPYLYRLVRGSMIDVLESEYIRIAWLKGMPPSRVLIRHALPNSLGATIQASALVLAYLLGGIVVVEYLFEFPGLGLALVNAVSARDVPVIQAVVMLFATGVVLFNLVADILTVYVNPRLRSGAA
jgi:peptide/nickel transport system permease protein